MSEAKLLDQMRYAIRLRQYSIATERVYLQLVRRFILFHGKRHPATMSKKEIEAFLTYLAVDRGVAPSTQNDAEAACRQLQCPSWHMARDKTTAERAARPGS